MEFKFSIIFGVILAIIVLAVANAVWMVGPAYVDMAAMIMIIIFTLVFTKLYLGKVSATVKDMFVTSIVWIIIVFISDVGMVLGYGLDFTTYYSNYMIYIGYVLIIIFAIIGYKLFGGKAPAPAAPAPEEEKPAPAEAPA